MPFHGMCANFSIGPSYGSSLLDFLAMPERYRVDAWSSLVHIRTMWTNDRIIEVLTLFQKKAVELFLANRQITPLALLFGTRHPETHQQGPIHIIVEWKGDFSDQAAQNVWALQVRGTANISHAVGVAHVAEAWYVPETVDHKDIEEHPDRKEALHMCVHFAPSVGVQPSGFLALIERHGDDAPTVSEWINGPTANGVFDFAAMIPPEEEQKEVEAAPPAT